MGDTDVTIMVKHLPSTLSPQHIHELLNAFGASEIKTTIAGRKQKPIAFATFKNWAAAEATVTRLHQLEVSGSRLCVEYVTPSNAPNLAHAKSIEDGLSEASGTQPGKRPKLTENRTNMNAILHSLGLDYPLNPKLKYHYPPPNYHVLTNIMNCLVAVPQFYTQVLHLMNKMNLQSPFETVAMDMSMGMNMSSRNNQMIYEANKSSSEESELESDEEMSSMSTEVRNVEMGRTKLPRKTKQLLARCSLKKQSTTAPSEASSTGNVSTSSVFEVSDPLVAKRIEINLTAAKVTRDFESNLPLETGVIVQSEAIPLTPLTPATTTTIETVTTPTSQTAQQFITDDELRRSRISKEGMELLPVYKNYQIGKASSRLYLKNLAKQVEESDLKFIYGRFNQATSPGEYGLLDIRLLKDGRMKGQAFVTFLEEAWAAKALDATNGYVLHGKPIVVQFARSTKPKET